MKQYTSKLSHKCHTLFIHPWQPNHDWLLSFEVKCSSLGPTERSCLQFVFFSCLIYIPQIPYLPNQFVTMFIPAFHQPIALLFRTTSQWMDDGECFSRKRNLSLKTHITFVSPIHSSSSISKIHESLSWDDSSEDQTPDSCLAIISRSKGTECPLHTPFCWGIWPRTCKYCTGTQVNIPSHFTWHTVSLIRCVSPLLYMCKILYSFVKKCKSYLQFTFSLTTFHSVAVWYLTNT